MSRKAIENRHKIDLIWLEFHYQAWNDYAAKGRALWNAHPPKTSDCGRFWMYSDFYMAELDKMSAKKAKTLGLYSIYCQFLHHVHFWP